MKSHFDYLGSLAHISTCAGSMADLSHVCPEKPAAGADCVPMRISFRALDFVDDLQRWGALT